MRIINALQKALTVAQLVLLISHLIWCMRALKWNYVWLCDWLMHKPCQQQEATVTKWCVLLRIFNKMCFSGVNTTSRITSVIVSGWKNNRECWAPREKTLVYTIFLFPVGFCRASRASVFICDDFPLPCISIRSPHSAAWRGHQC